MPKYHLVSDLLNDLVVEGGDINEVSHLRKIIEYEWNNGNIELLIHCINEGTPSVLDALQRMRTIDLLASSEKWIRCSICSRGSLRTIVTEFNNPFISDKGARYVMKGAAAAGLVSVERANNAAMQPNRRNGVASLTQSEAPFEATVARNVSLDELKKLVCGSEHQSES